MASHKHTPGLQTMAGQESSDYNEAPFRASNGKGPTAPDEAVSKGKSAPVLTGRRGLLGMLAGLLSLPAARAVGMSKGHSSSAPPGQPPRTDQSPALIVLLTDFGSRGALLGSLKGAIYRRDPLARLDSLTHDIPKFDIEEAAQTLAMTTSDFPAGTVFVVVVDPGTGRPRRPIALETDNGHLYLAPDNGVLTQVAIRFGVKRVHEVTSNEVVRCPPHQSTFLSRDVFAPAAAELARGRLVDQLGARVEDLYLMTTRPARLEGSVAIGQVVLVDGFGNAQTNIPGLLLSQLGADTGAVLTVELEGQRLTMRWGRAYREVPTGERVAVITASGDLQLAINQGNLAEHLKLSRGSAVKISIR